MKRILLILGLIGGFLNCANATHLFRNNASNINSGTLPNARLDPSSVTLQGNLVTISTVAKGLNDIITGNVTIQTNLAATNTWTGPHRFTSSMTVQNSVTVDSISVLGTITTTNPIQSPLGSVFVTSMTVYGTITTTNPILSPGTTNYTYSGIYISSMGVDTNILQATITYINIMGDVYMNVSTQVSMALSPCAGGRDGSAEAASRRYIIWAISKTGNQGFGLILSDAGNVRPTLPAGYTKWRAIGTVYNNGSSNIIPFTQRNRTVTYFSNVDASGKIISIGSTPGTTWTAIDASASISSTAISCFVAAYVQIQSNGVFGLTIREKFANPYDRNSSYSDMQLMNATTADFYGISYMVWFKNNPQEMEYISKGAGTGQLYVYILSYEEGIL